MAAQGEQGLKPMSEWVLQCGLMWATLGDKKGLWSNKFGELSTSGRFPMLITTSRLQGLPQEPCLTPLTVKFLFSSPF